MDPIKNSRPHKTFVYVSSPVSSCPGGGGERFLDFFTDQFSDVRHIFIGSSRAIYKLFCRKGYPAFLSPAGFEPVSIWNFLLIPLSFLLGVIQFFRYREIFKKADIIISPTAFCEIFFLFPWLSRYKKKCLHIVLSNKIPNAFIKTPLRGMLSRGWSKDTVVFCSQTQRTDWISHNLVSDRSRMIYNGVMVHDRPLNRSLSAGHATVTLGFLARIHWEKGIDIFLRALSLLPPVSLKIRVLIGGDGPYKPTCDALIKQLTIPDNISIEWLGLVADPVAFYELIDALVFPSRREGFSLAILEAWERGTPVIASDIPSFLEAKQKTNDLEKHLLFKGEDPADLAKKITFFIENRSRFFHPQQRQALHETIRNNFSLDNMIRTYREIVKTILSENKNITGEAA